MLFLDHDAVRLCSLHFSNLIVKTLLSIHPLVNTGGMVVSIYRKRARCRPLDSGVSTANFFCVAWFVEVLEGGFPYLICASIV